jgi:hypothetical protein
MNIIKKTSLSALGYGFIDAASLPKGKDEYHLRNLQNRSGIAYRKLSAYEIEVLVRNRNTSDDWNNILVGDAFNPELVKNCKFYGLVRIGKLEPYCLEFSDLKMPVGLYNSIIISCDFGDNVVVDNVNYISHYIIGNEVIITNVNELVATNHAKFGNGIVKAGEKEIVRVWLELSNENTGRRVLPFNGMLPADAYLWTKYKDDEVMQQQFLDFTQKKFDTQRGYYGKVGDRTVIKNCKIIKDVWIGTDAYLKGANKLKNLTINSAPNAKSQIGEGCEMVNGTIGEGCRIFYGVKAVRFIMAPQSQLKYGARLINSYLGHNSTISCCEVLNTLIFPAHEQHHNNSFLCASIVMGQSNIAAGATIGSNHNSRSPDGEIVAARGFWPGLCVSLKHNSKFASYTMIAKGDYHHEINLPIPFSLVSNNVSKDELVVMPGYWFMYNMYALARNAWKYVDRDKRLDKSIIFEYDYLAPDTVNELFEALRLLKYYTGKAYLKEDGKLTSQKEDEIAKVGEALLESQKSIVGNLDIVADGIENSKRKVKLVKVLNAYHLFKELIGLYAANEIVRYVQFFELKNGADLQAAMPSKLSRNKWLNIGGQLMQADDVKKLREKINNGKIKSWDDVHATYKHLSENYYEYKFRHAMASIGELMGLDMKKANKEKIKQILQSAISTKEWMVKGIYDSRAKDYTSEFRKMMYDSPKEMNAVVGKLEDNSFIKQETDNLVFYKKQVAAILKSL